MGFRRGLLFGFFVGAVGVVMSRRAQEEIERTPNGGESGGGGERGFKELLEEARGAAREEMESTDARLRRRFTHARETGSLPDAD